MRLTVPRPFIADIGPKPGGSSFAGAWGQQLYRRVICEEGLSLLNMIANGHRQTLKQRGGLGTICANNRLLGITIE